MLGFQNEGVNGDNGLRVVRVVGWERYAWLKHGFSTRVGGVSRVYGGIRWAGVPSI